MVTTERPDENLISIEKGVLTEQNLLYQLNEETEMAICRKKTYWPNIFRYNILVTERPDENLISIEKGVLTDQNILYQLNEETEMAI